MGCFNELNCWIKAGFVPPSGGLHILAYQSGNQQGCGAITFTLHATSSQMYRLAVWFQAQVFADKFCQHPSHLLWVIHSSIVSFPSHTRQNSLRYFYSRTSASLVADVKSEMDFSYFFDVSFINPFFTQRQADEVIFGLQEQIFKIHSWLKKTAHRSKSYF